MAISNNKRFNCGGYALGTREWLKFSHYHEEGHKYEERYNHEEYYVKELISKYNLKQIDSFEDIYNYDMVILFRLGDFGGWGDFHFVKYYPKKNRAYDKPGDWDIRRISTKNLLTEPWPIDDKISYNKDIYVFVQ